MLSWRHILREPFGKKSSPEEDGAIVREESGEDVPNIEDALFTHPVSLERLENMDNDMDEAQAKNPEEDGGILTQPVRLEVEPAAEDKNENTLFESNEDEERETEDKDEDDSISSIFNSDDDEDENPLAGLIKALPDVAAGDLITDMQEVETMIRQWHQS